MDLVGLETGSESVTSDGSIDITVRTEDYIYVIELKYVDSANEALNHLSRDARPVRPRPDTTGEIIRIGVNFSSETRCIEDWLIQKP